MIKSECTAEEKQAIDNAITLLDPDKEAAVHVLEILRDAGFSPDEAKKAVRLAGLIMDIAPTAVDRIWAR